MATFVKLSAIRKVAIFAGLMAALVVAGCAAPRSKPVALQSSQDPRFILELSPGSHYKTTTGWFIFSLPIYPQVAAWVETTDGHYLGTIYITGKGEKNSWIAAPSTGRPEALPVWSQLKKGNLDSVSAATSAGMTVRESSLAAGLPAGDYVVMLETNRSYDYNATYTKANSGVSGQPSLVYRALLSVGKGPSKASFAPIGTGSLDGSDGAIHDGLQGIDTALALFTGMVIEYKE